MISLLMGTLGLSHLVPTNTVDDHLTYMLLFTMLLHITVVLLCTYQYQCLSVPLYKLFCDFCL